MMVSIDLIVKLQESPDLRAAVNKSARFVACDRTATQPLWGLPESVIFMLPVYVRLLTAELSSSSEVMQRVAKRGRRVHSCDVAADGVQYEDLEAPTEAVQPANEQLYDCRQRTMSAFCNKRDRLQTLH